MAPRQRVRNDGQTTQEIVAIVATGTEPKKKLCEQYGG
jgi:hypothetical protein